jgi:hypothetical protein
MTTTETLSRRRRHVSLRAFQPDEVPTFNGDATLNSDCGSTALGKVVVANNIVPARFINQLGGEVAKGADAQPDRVEAYSTRINAAVYTAVERMYKLTPEGETPQAFFQRHMRVGDSTLRFLAEQVNPADPRVTAPEVDYASPADVVKTLASPATGQVEKQDLTARLAFALTSAEQQPYYEGTQEVLAAVDAMITQDIITDPRKSGTVYTIHNNETNVLDRAAVDLDSLFAEEIKEDAHVKAHDLQGDFQHIGMTDEPHVGLVAVRSRIKSSETALLKTVRAAILRTEGEQSTGEDLSKGDNLIATDTKDLVGSTFVALEAKDSYDPKVDALRAKVIAQFKERFPNLKDADFVEDSKTNKKTDQADFNFQRVLVNNIPGIEGYYEVMFFGQDYFDYKYAVGNTDPETGKPDGCAHTLYEGTRFFKTYTAIANPDDPDGIERRMYAARSEQLIEDHRVDIADLEKQYEAQQRFKSEGDIFNSRDFARTVYPAI